MKDYIGYGAVDNLRDCVKELNNESILIIHGKNSYESSGAKTVVEKGVFGFNVNKWCNFTTNPKWEELQEGLKIAKDKKTTLIIAVGGGTVIDMAKLVSIFSINEIALDDAINNRFQSGSVPLIAIPTTAGAGSEATQFAVVWKNNCKYSIDSCTILPTCCIIDPAFIKNQSEKTAAAPLFDALGQAVESYWSVKSTDESKSYATESIKLLLPEILSQQSNNDQYFARAKGAHLAGKAINITRTTAAHAVSYAFTAYKGISHGHAVMLTLPNFFVYNSSVSEQDCLDSRGVDYVKSAMQELNALFGCKNAEDTRALLNTCLDKFNLEHNLYKLGFRSEIDYEYVLDNGFNPQRVKNNPRLLTRNALHTMLTKQTSY